MSSQRLSLVVFMVLMGLATLGIAKETSKEETDESTSRDEGSPTIIVCNDLKEKIETVAPVQQKVSADLVSVGDQMLCDALSQQCEYFYKITKYYEKEYRSLCQKDFELKISACNYETNGCQKAEESGNPAKAASKYRAGV